MEQHHFLQLVFEVAVPEICCNVCIRARLVSRIALMKNWTCETPWRCVWLLSCVQVEDRKQSYLDTYDVVLVKDETMEVPNAIMLYLTGNKWKSMESRSMEPPMPERVGDAALRSELEVFIHQPVCHFSLYDKNFLGWGDRRCSRTLDHLLLNETSFSCSRSSQFMVEVLLVQLL